MCDGKIPRQALRSAPACCFGSQHASEHVCIQSSPVSQANKHFLAYIESPSLTTWKFLKHSTLQTPPRLIGTPRFTDTRNTEGRRQKRCRHAIMRCDGCTLPLERLMVLRTQPHKWRDDCCLLSSRHHIGTRDSARGEPSSQSSCQLHPRDRMDTLHIVQNKDMTFDHIDNGDGNEEHQNQLIRIPPDAEAAVTVTRCRSRFLDGGFRRRFRIYP